jgi:hypothetical protein
MHRMRLYRKRSASNETRAREWFDPSWLRDFALLPPLSHTPAPQAASP